MNEKKSVGIIGSLSSLKHNVINNKTLDEQNKRKLEQLIDSLESLSHTVSVKDVNKKLKTDLNIIKELLDENSKKIANQAIGLFLLEYQQNMFLTLNITTTENNKEKNCLEIIKEVGFEIADILKDLREIGKNEELFDMLLNISMIKIEKKLYLFDNAITENQLQNICQQDNIAVNMDYYNLIINYYNSIINDYVSTVNNTPNKENFEKTIENLRNMPENLIKDIENYTESLTINYKYNLKLIPIYKTLIGNYEKLIIYEELIKNKIKEEKQTEIQEELNNNIKKLKEEFNINENDPNFKNFEAYYKKVFEQYYINYEFAKYTNKDTKILETPEEFTKKIFDIFITAEVYQNHFEELNEKVETKTIDTNKISELKFKDSGNLTIGINIDGSIQGFLQQGYDSGLFEIKKGENPIIFIDSKGNTYNNYTGTEILKPIFNLEIKKDYKINQ